MRAGQALDIDDNELMAAVELLRDLIRLPSYSGSELEAQLLFAEHLDRVGMRPEVIRSTPSDDGAVERASGPCVVGRLRAAGQGGGRSIVLNSHMDVVPEGRLDMWKLGGPFDGALSSGRIVGRGAVDAKGCLVAFLLALRVLRSSGIRLRGEVQLQSVADEESGGLGTCMLLDRGLAADAVVVGEPTGLAICPGARGFVTFRWSIDCATGHPGAVRQRPNAVVVGSTVLTRFIRDAGDAVAVQMQMHPLWRRAGKPRTAIVTHVSTHSSVRGSVDQMEFTGLMEMLPGDRPEAVRSAVATLLDEAFSEHAALEAQYTVTWLRTLEGCATEDGSPLVAIFADAVAANGSDAVIAPFCAASDMHYFADRGFPAVHFGPGQLALAHGPDEYLEVAELGTAASSVASFLCDWCGVAS